MVFLLEFLALNDGDITVLQVVHTLIEYFRHISATEMAIEAIVVYVVFHCMGDIGVLEDIGILDNIEVLQDTEVLMVMGCLTIICSEPLGVGRWQIRDCPSH